MKRTRRILHIHIVLALLAIATLILALYRVPYAEAQTGTATFGAAGDYSDGSDFPKTIANMKASGLNFAVALGDFAYGGDPTSWSTTVVSTLGTSFPFQLIAGNHDNTTINSYTAILTNKMTSISSDAASSYGKQYYFDYPPASPLIRVILLGPNDSPLSYTYAKNSTNYNWVSNAIDDARAKNIPWIAAGMHKNCITSGTKSCEIGTDVFNLFISKKIDLILQGHDHTYQRSFPLRNATSQPTAAAGCATVTTSFNAACVNTAAGNTYPKSAGTTLVIDGTGGQGLYSNSQSSQNGFFANKNFSSHGFTKYTITSQQITAQYMNNAAGGFTDSFTITNDAGQPTVTNVPPTITNIPASIAPTLTGGPNSCTVLPGDANHDGLINISDFLVWRTAFLKARTPTP